MSLVTVRAQDLAFRYLQENASDGDAKVNHVADVGGLCGRVQMIELQDDRIAFAALHAWMLAQIFGDKEAACIALKWLVPLIPLQVRSLIVLIMLLRNLPTALAAA